ncbi:MAG: Kae1-associated kinase Bud32 [Candidatus Bathyarchaeia archaeon]|nr:Kae1-associated kinase Bud32 [Candidatus Bathyarchaeota archaeon]
MLLKKGAEANLFLEKWHGRKVIMKKRLPKHYRLQQLDEQIRTYRTLHEPQLIHRAKEAGVPTPTILMIDPKNSTIIMEFVEGKQVKQVLNHLKKEERLRLCRYIGELIGRLHHKGIIHGDLTTSNMILTPHGKVVFVDFGLGEYSKELEIRGVDLHLMKRALQSTHFRYAEESFGAVMDGYASIVGDNVAENVYEKIREIEKRGRYVAEREER